VRTMGSKPLLFNVSACRISDCPRRSLVKFCADALETYPAITLANVRQKARAIIEALESGDNPGRLKRFDDGKRDHTVQDVAEKFFAIICVRGQQHRRLRTPLPGIARQIGRPLRPESVGPPFGDVGTFLPASSIARRAHSL